MLLYTPGYSQTQAICHIASQSYSGNKFFTCYVLMSFGCGKSCCAPASKTDKEESGSAAVPSSPVPSAAQPKAVPQPWIGVSHRSLDHAAAKKMGDPKLRGALVTAVAAGGPSDAAGIKEDDVIVAVDGKPIPGSPTLAAAVSHRAPGSKITLVIGRGKVRRNVVIVVAERPRE